MGYSKKYDFHFTDKADYSSKWEQHNKEERSEYNKVRSADPEVRARKKIQKARWDEENEEHKIKYSKEYNVKPENKKHRSEYNKVYNKENKEMRLEQRRRWASTAGKEKHFMENYGITTDQRNSLISEQDNKCARCYLPFDLDGSGNTSNAPVVDHDHSYPKGDPDSIRSIIHQKCNIMIGMHSDSIEELEKSIKFLKKYSKVV